MKFVKRIGVMLLIAINLLVSSVVLLAQTSAPKHSGGAIFISDSEYAKLPGVSWDTLRAHSNMRALEPRRAAGVVMLKTPPVGDQGSEFSCVGWAVGYTAAGILAYSKYGCWDMAMRSPSYVFNQIKHGSTCNLGSTFVDALNLVKEKGVCSYSLMPYLDGECSTIPDAALHSDAALHTVDWRKLDNNDVDGIKQALNLGLPVVVSFKVYQSFKDMWYKGNGVWLYNTGNYENDHASCIVGYDDTKQMFKVQNQWGDVYGDRGFFWVPYDFVYSGCFKEAFVLYDMNPAYPSTVSGSDFICSSGASYTVSNLPAGCTVSWSGSSNLTLTSASGNLAKFVPNGRGDGTVTATINRLECGYTMAKSIVVGAPKPNIAGPMEPNYIHCIGNSVSFHVFPYLPEATSYQWYLSGDDLEIPVSKKRTASVACQNSGMHSVTVMQYIPGCGWSDFAEKSFEVAPCGAASNIILYPNPAGSSITLTLQEQGRAAESVALPMRAASNSVQDYSLAIYNTQNQLVKQASGLCSGSSLSVADLPEGIYVVHIIVGSTTQRQMLQIKR